VILSTRSRLNAARAIQDNLTRFITCYQGLFAPFIRQKQEAALRFRVLFGPKSKAAMFVRNQLLAPYPVRP
jgi:hypothetical protein